MPRGDYERHAAKILFNYGRRVVLGSEKSAFGVKIAEGLLDDVAFEIKGIEGAGKTAWRHKFQSASAKKAETLVLYYPDSRLFDLQKMEEAYAHYLRNSRSGRIKTVYYIVDDKLRRL
jgi:hypothetical protein